ncbi:MAG: hypothetical protein PHS44_07865 [Candidatus Dojkabacteria bacterium]|nr:hypothetical protein [Candidatus Dojkabacteria bacterium]
MFGCGFRCVRNSVVAELYEAFVFHLNQEEKVTCPDSCFCGREEVGTILKDAIAENSLLKRNILLKDLSMIRTTSERDYSIRAVKTRKAYGVSHRDAGSAPRLFKR